MTDYEIGFMTKCAQSGLSKADAAALMDYVNKQRSEEEKRQIQRQAMRDANRAERVRTAKAAMMFLLGSGGAYLGGLAGGKLTNHWGGALGGLLLGGAGGALGGWHLGKKIGNRDADRQEAWEDRTGQDIASQNTQRAAQIAAYSSILNSNSPGTRASWLRLAAPGMMY